MRFFQVYQYLAPAILFPLSYWLWWERYAQSHALVLLVMSIPILFAYVVPGIGTNVLGIWEFNTRLRLGKFRPHHGFVFGSATSLIAFCCLGPHRTGTDGWEIARAGLVLGSTLAFWNWFYDIEALRAGFLVVYNRPFVDGQGAEAIATDYAPTIFGGFGLVLGASIRLVEWQLLDQQRWGLYWPLVIGCNLAGLVVPVALFMACSYWRHGTWGLTAMKGD